VHGTGVLRLLTLASATVILVMAANTSFADFPRLAALHAGDGFLPKQFTFRGSRLVFSWGVTILAALASLLIVIFFGRVSRLIPLYAIGVFLSFTLSQSGMVIRWRKVGRMMANGELPEGKEVITLGSILKADRHWRLKQMLNGLGAVVTAVVVVVFLASKFTQGAWITALLIPSLLWLFFRIHKHYRHVAQVMSTTGQHVSAVRRPVVSLVLVADVHRETLRLVEFANSLQCPWQAVHIAVDEAHVPAIQAKWRERVGIGELVIVPSPYRGLSRPIRDYVLEMLAEHPEGYVQVIMGQLQTGNPLTQLLHQNSHMVEQLALQDLERVVTTVVPIQLQALVAAAPAEHRSAPAEVAPEEVN
jgi:hypothetical protein